MQTASHVLGYVAAVSEQDLTGDPLLELPDFRIGKSGVEKSEDLKLRGSRRDAARSRSTPLAGSCAS